MPAPIVPSYILEALAQHGDDRLKQAASRTLALDEAFRAARERSLVVPAQTVGTPGSPDRTIRDAGNEERRRVRSSERRARTRPATPPRRGLRRARRDVRPVLVRCSSATRSTARPAAARASSITARTTTTRSGTARRWSSGTATASLQPLHHRRRRDRSRARPRRHRGEAGLVYRDQSGALNESVRTCFGSMVKQHALGQTAEQADWLIGAGMLADGSTAWRCGRCGRPEPRTTTRVSAARTRSRRT